jgi:hypothetical protein
MKLNSLTINDIKSFNGIRTFDFSASDKINTVSGINGSGKTTVFKSIILAQKIFFAEQINKETDRIIDYTKDIANVFSKVNSFIRLEFRLNNSESELASFTIRCVQKKKEFVKVELEGSDNHLQLIRTFWDIKSPTNIIVYVDSNRNIHEEDFSNENIRLSQNDNIDLAIEYVSQPEKFFSSTYERIFKDYVRERIIPSTPRHDLPHYISKIFIHNIIDYLKITNFTGIERNNQFTLLVKKESGGRSNSYDVRNLSSGEKTLFYIYHFLCYVKNIGMLIIDEPENNLHENMLSRFVHSLNEICTDEHFSELISKIAKKNKESFTAKVSRHVRSYYKEHKLSQVFLLTHSKNLVYNNFAVGKNYVLDNELKIIDYDNHEKILREIGLSKIINKVLFVEGKTENEMLESIFSPYNIKVKSLGNCEAVIETYKRYMKIQDEIRDVQFCFMIDQDTRSEQEINSLRSSDESFFDEHFIVLARHEIENYFLEAKMFHELYKKHKSSYPTITIPAEKDIEAKIFTFATAEKERVLRKRIQNLNQKSLAAVKLAISGKELPIDSINSYTDHIDQVFERAALKGTIDTIKNNYDSIDFVNKNWQNDWKKLCDGKVVLNKFISAIAPELGITSKRAKKEIEEIGLKSSTSEVGEVIRQILGKLR